MRLQWVTISIVTALAFRGGAIPPAFSETFESCKSLPHETPAAAQERLTTQILVDVLKYAREHAHPVTGFVLDTVNNYDSTPHEPHLRASISSTGFMMALVSNLYLKGIVVDKQEAIAYCRRPIKAILDREAQDAIQAKKRRQTGSSDPQTDISYRGWWSHFIEWSTGTRWENSEYALTDSTWMLAGMLVCAATFPDTDLPQLVNSVYSQVNYNDMRTDGGTKPSKLTLSLAYTPEPSVIPQGKTADDYGYSPFQWEIYQHSWLVYLLGIGSPNLDYRLPKESWSAWKRTGAVMTVSDSRLEGKFLYGAQRALFSHFFPAVFMPPQEIKEACHIDYFENSRLATRFNRASALSDTTSETFRHGFWGLDAGPNPNSKVLSLVAPGTLNVGSLQSEIYGVNTPYKRNGNACLACAVAAAMFEPELVLRSLQQWCDDPIYGSKIWGKYGPANGIDLDYGWISPHALSGIVGPMALSVANLDSQTSIWKQFASNASVKFALAQLASAPLPTAVAGQDRCHLSEK